MIIYYIKTWVPDWFKPLLRDDRGISMTEGVIVIPFFLLIWMGFIFLHKSYTGAIEAQVRAQNLAFQGAASGHCEGEQEGGGTNEEVDDALSDSEAQGNVGNTAVSTNILISESGGSSLFDWSHHRIRSSVEVGGIPEVFDGPTNTLKGGAKLMCNMEPRDGLGDMIFGFLEGVFE